jgi:hypothetical protein
MKVILLHPDTCRWLPQNASEVYDKDSVILLSRYSPLGQALIMDHDAESLVDWLRQLDESIQALQ